TWFPMNPLLRRRSSRAAHEVDDDGHAGEIELLAEAVLDPVAVIARHEAWIVDVQAEAGRPGAHLCAIEQVEPLAEAGGARALLAQLAEEAVQLRSRDTARVLFEEVLDPV